MSLMMQLPKEGSLITTVLGGCLNFLVINRELLDGISQVLNKMVIIYNDAAPQLCFL